MKTKEEIIKEAELVLGHKLTHYIKDNPLATQLVKNCMSIYANQKLDEAGFILDIRDRHERQHNTRQILQLKDKID